MAINLRDYSRTAAQRGWGAGWPSCGGAKAAGTAVVTAARSGVRMSWHKRVARLAQLLIDETERLGYRLIPGQCGAYNCRAIGGTSSPSNHSWGLAGDLNWLLNPMKKPLTSDIPDEVVDLWNRYGFAWGGDYSGTPDPMHFEFMGTPGQADEMTALALREFTAPLEDDDMSQAQVDQLRRDIGFARDQILTELGVDPATAPVTRPAAERAAIAKARRVDVGYALEQLTARLDALAKQGVATGDGGGVAGLSDADKDDIARRVVDLLSKRTAA